MLLVTILGVLSTISIFRATGSSRWTISIGCAFTISTISRISDAKVLVTTPWLVGGAVS